VNDSRPLAKAPRHRGGSRDRAEAARAPARPRAVAGRSRGRDRSTRWSRSQRRWRGADRH